MASVTIENITSVVTKAVSREAPARNREILQALIRHMHEFCREVKLTHAEWLAACEFLCRAGDISDDKRNEFILVSDILGVEVLVDMMDHPVIDGESESTVLGPFYRENPPVLAAGASIVQKGFPDQETLRVRGRILDTRGAPIAGATLDVWEDAPNGLYEQQDPDQPDYNLRGRFESDADGRYDFVALRPVPYPIPFDGAAGELLNYMGHHPWRPGHIHFLIAKPGYRTLITQVYDRDTRYLDDDSVFAVKESLIGDLQPTPQGSETNLELHFDFVLRARASEAAA